MGQAGTKVRPIPSSRQRAIRLANDHPDIEDQGVQFGPHRILLDPPNSDVDLFDTTDTYRSWRRVKRSSRPDGYGGVKVESPGNCRKETIISPDDKLLSSFVTFFDHALLMIEDFESRATHEGWDAATQYVHFDKDSLYVAVRSVVDGPVSVSVYRDNVPSGETEGLVEVYSGELDSNSGIIRVYDSDEKVVLTVAGRRGRNRLTVFVDDLNWAVRVVVIFSEPA